MAEVVKNGGSNTSETQKKSSLVLDPLRIELGCKRNRTKTFPPTMGQYRGSWLKANLNGDERTELIERIPDMPGINIIISHSSRSASVFDPLTLPENESQLENLKKVTKEVFGSNNGPEETVSRTDMTDDEIKTWYYWIHRLVKNNDAKIIEGTLPTIQMIESLPGLTEVSQFNQNVAKNKYRETFRNFIERIEQMKINAGSV